MIFALHFSAKKVSKFGLREVTPTIRKKTLLGLWEANPILIYVFFTPGWLVKEGLSGGQPEENSKKINFFT
jgi:hypothetical protein